MICYNKNIKSSVLNWNVQDATLFYRLDGVINRFTQDNMVLLLIFLLKYDTMVSLKSLSIMFRSYNSMM